MVSIGKSFLTSSGLAIRSRRLISTIVSPIPGISALKGGTTGFDGFKKVKGGMVSVLVNQTGAHLTCTVFPANMHDTQAYKPTLDAFTIPEASKSPATISADAAYDARNIRQYNRNRGIRSNIPANRRFRRLQNERSFWFDQELYKERNAIERFFGWIEALKKITPRYERYETSFLGLIHLACAIMIWRIMG